MPPNRINSVGAGSQIQGTQPIFPQMDNGNQPAPTIEGNIQETEQNEKPIET